jgi:hypothetical protein
MFFFLVKINNKLLGQVSTMCFLVALGQSWNWKTEDKGLLKKSFNVYTMVKQDTPSSPPRKRWAFAV